MTMDQHRPVVVGHDGTDASSGALSFAIAEAQRGGALLRVVHALPLLSSAFLDLPVSAEQLESERQHMEATLRADVARLAGDVEVQIVVCHGAPVSVLLGAADDTRLLVVGREQRTGLRRLIGGATAEGVAARVTSEVVVVPQDWREDRRRQRVVVALKGPEHSTELLGAAFRRADQAASVLRVVHAWAAEERLDGLRPEGWTPQALLIERAAGAIEELLRPWRRAYPSVTVDVEVHDADPRTDVLEETAAADLVVLLRRDAPVLGPHLGRVLRPVLRSADCPVLVVPSAEAALPPLELELEREGALLR